MSASTFYTTVCGVAACVPLFLHIIGRFRPSRRSPNGPEVFVSTLLAVLMVVWLSFASTYLLWVFPLALLVSASLGYAVGAKLPGLACTELQTSIVAIAVAGVVSAAYFWRNPDSAFGHMPAALLVANYLLFLGMATMCLVKREKNVERG